MTNNVTRDFRQSLFTYMGWKNVLDRCLAFLALILLFPFFLILIMVIRIDSPGNPAIHQERVGKQGSRFTLNKFRSMFQEHDDKKYRTYIMTGTWQALLERRWLSFNEVVRIDLDYISKLSLFLDIKIASLTIRELLTFGSHMPKAGENNLVRETLI
jgi:lipopolysaccharide/colanic/teichoic acid biosynthesis glycosyltransferase